MTIAILWTSSYSMLDAEVIDEAEGASLKMDPVERALLGAFWAWESDQAGSPAFIEVFALDGYRVIDYDEIRDYCHARAIQEEAEREANAQARPEVAWIYLHPPADRKATVEPHPYASYYTKDEAVTAYRELAKLVGEDRVVISDHLLARMPWHEGYAPTWDGPAL